MTAAPAHRANEAGGPGQGEEPPDSPQPPHTGDPVVDAALASLSDVGSQPVAEQVETYTHAHSTLQDRLADIDG